MFRVTLYVIAIFIIGLALVAPVIASEPRLAIFGLPITAVMSWIFYQIGYEMGLRAPTDSGSVFKDPLFFDVPFPERLRKLIVDLFSVGFSKRRDKVNNERAGTKSSNPAEGYEVRTKLDDASRRFGQAFENKPRG